MPDFSPLPSPSNNPLQNLKVIAQDTTIYIAPDVNGKTGSTSTWTGATLGNDTTGDGTLAKPFASLSKAWSEAQKYIITGNAILYIQFQKGIYELPSLTAHNNFFPDDLYHPQGGNIIIQGDAGALEERYIWKVGSYNWDLAPYSYFGHTGEVNLWSSRLGLTHGFTADDVGGYFAIVNQTLARGDYKVTNPAGDNSVVDNKWDKNYPIRHALNHGYPYEEGDAILGLAKIISATAAGQTLGLAFRNINMDSRIIGFMGGNHTNGKIAGGLRNAVTWCDLAKNYPESQYGEPVGYYGQTAWGSGNTAYPGLPTGLTHISNDVISAVNFPVIIRTNGGAGGKPPIRMGTPGSKLKAIRNIMFVAAEYDGATYGSQPLIQGISRRPGFLNNGPTTCVYMYGDAQIGIRHIGVLGYGEAIRAAKGSLITDYTPSRAIFGNLDYNEYRRTPVLIGSHLWNGGLIINDGAQMRVGENAADSDYHSHTVYMDGFASAISTNGGSVQLDDFYGINVAQSVPVFRISLNIPVFAGSTVGTTAGIYSAGAWSTNTYKNATLHLASGGKIGRIFHVSAGPTLPCWNNTNMSWSGGLTAGQSGPHYTQRMDFYGYKLDNYTLSTRADWLTGTGVDGFEIRAYTSSDETGFVSGLTFGKSKIVLQGYNGQTVTGTTTGTNGLTLGISGPYGDDPTNYWDGGYYNNSKNSYPNISCVETGSVSIRNAYLDGGYVGVGCSSRSATVNILESLSIKSYCHTGVFASRGNIFFSPGASVTIKNPHFGYPFSGVASSAPGYPYFLGCARGMAAEFDGVIGIDSSSVVVNIGWPQGVSFTHVGESTRKYGLYSSSSKSTSGGYSTSDFRGTHCLFYARTRGTIQSNGLFSAFCHADDGGNYIEYGRTSGHSAIIYAESGAAIDGCVGIGQPAWTTSQTIPSHSQVYTSPGYEDYYSYGQDGSNYTTTFITGLPGITTAGGLTHGLILTRRTWQPDTVAYSARSPLYNVSANDTAHYEWWKPFYSKVGRMGRTGGVIGSPSTNGPATGEGSYYTRIPAMRTAAPTNAADAGTFISGVTMGGGYTFGRPLAAINGTGIIMPSWS